MPADCAGLPAHQPQAVGSGACLEGGKRPRGGSGGARPARGAAALGGPEAAGAARNLRAAAVARGAAPSDADPRRSQCPRARRIQTGQAEGASRVWCGTERSGAGARRGGGEGLPPGSRGVGIPGASRGWLRPGWAVVPGAVELGRQRGVAGSGRRRRCPAKPPQARRGGRRFLLAFFPQPRAGSASRRG